MIYTEVVEGLERLVDGSEIMIGCGNHSPRLRTEDVELVQDAYLLWAHTWARLNVQERIKSITTQSFYLNKEFHWSLVASQA